MRQRGGFVKVGLPDRHSIPAPARQFRCAAVSPILPAMLVLAALAAQFSAAVADTGGSGGLVFELTGGRLSQRQAYAILCLAGLGSPGRRASSTSSLCLARLRLLRRAAVGHRRHGDAAGRGSRPGRILRLHGGARPGDRPLRHSGRMMAPGVPWPAKDVETLTKHCRTRDAIPRKQSLSNLLVIAATTSIDDVTEIDPRRSQERCIDLPGTHAAAVRDGRLRRSTPQIVGAAAFLPQRIRFPRAAAISRWHRQCRPDRPRRAAASAGSCRDRRHQLDLPRVSPLTPAVRPQRPHTKRSTRRKLALSTMPLSEMRKAGITAKASSECCI